jgi:hypothetical protein
VLDDFPYPLDVALERFWIGDKQKHATLLHFGTDPVTADLPAWFGCYNARQTIEAGIKEGKGVFEMHHLKVRSAPGLHLQEQFPVFAASFALGGTLAGNAVPAAPVGLARHDTAEGERASQGRRAHVGMGSLAGTGLFVKVHGRQHLCWSVS